MYKTIAHRDYLRPHQTWFYQHQSRLSDGCGGIIMNQHPSTPNQTADQINRTNRTPSPRRSPTRSSTTRSTPTHSSTRSSPTRSSTRSSTARSITPRHRLDLLPHPPRHPRQPPAPLATPTASGTTTYQRTQEPVWKPMECPTWQSHSHRLYNIESSVMSHQMPGATTTRTTGGWDIGKEYVKSSKIIPKNVRIFFFFRSNVATMSIFFLSEYYLLLKIAF